MVHLNLEDRIQILTAQIDRSKGNLCRWLVKMLLFSKWSMIDMFDSYVFEQFAIYSNVINHMDQIIYSGTSQ